MMNLNKDKLVIYSLKHKLQLSLNKNISALANNKKLLKQSLKVSNKAHNCFKMRVEGKYLGLVYNYVLTFTQTLLDSKGFMQELEIVHQKCTYKSIINTPCFLKISL